MVFGKKKQELTPPPDVPKIETWEVPITNKKVFSQAARPAPQPPQQADLSQIILSMPDFNYRYEVVLSIIAINEKLDAIMQHLGLQQEQEEEQ